MNKLKQIWYNKHLILEGLKNLFFKDKFVEEVYTSRLKICKGCAFYDSDGSSPKATVKGAAACSHCGCSLAVKLRSLDSSCPLDKSLWEPVKRNG